MKALVTGASSGMGRDMARILAKRGYELIIAARRKDRLDELAEELGPKTQVICCDLSDTAVCKALFEQLKNEDIELVINNAGFGLFGAFDETDLDGELRMIDTNIKAVHTLTKLFLEKFSQRDSGYLLNVSSSAAFFPGPLLSAYYASKSYVLRYTEAMYEELRQRGSHVHVSVFCPGPVSTEFGSVANVSFSMKGLESRRAAEYAIRQMFAGKLIITPGLMMKTANFLRHLLPDKLLARAVYHIQKRKCSTR